MTFHKILVAVDGSELAAHAAEVAFDFAHSLGGTLALVHVVQPDVGGIPMEAMVTVEEIAALETASAQRHLDELHRRAPRELPTAQFLEIGIPAAEILRVAKEWSADVIVIGSHGRRGLGRALFGSVAEAVMRGATCPVLVVRTPN